MSKSLSFISQFRDLEARALKETNLEIARVNVKLLHYPSPNKPIIIKILRVPQPSQSEGEKQDIALQTTPRTFAGAPQGLC